MGYVLANGLTKPSDINKIDSTLNNNSWAAISNIAQSGNASNYWSVGDTKTITINGKVGNTTFSNLSIDVFIIGINHNESREGKGIHFQVGKINGVAVALVDSKYGSTSTSEGYFNQSPDKTSRGGWVASYMRNVICFGFQEALPVELQNSLKTVMKYTNNCGEGSNNSSDNTFTREKVFYLSEYEATGTKKCANTMEYEYQKRYAYYANGNSLVKYKHNSTSTTCRWALRSPSSNGDYFTVIETDGSAINSTNTSYSYGVSFAFVV